MDHLDGDARSFLLVCDTWSPHAGGVPAFNRALAAALAGQGYRTRCLVRHADAAELADASAHGVQLVEAEASPRGPEMLVPHPLLPVGSVDVVIGHDRFSGAAAWVYARKYLGCRFAQVVHTAPAEIERYKTAARATERLEAREAVLRRLGQDADVVAAVGPRLARYATDLLADCGSPMHVVQLDPAVEPHDHTVRRLPAATNVLVLGRAEDLQLKGLDLAARAIAALPDTGGQRARLLVRGAPVGECDALHAQLVKISGLARDRVDVRAFTTDVGELRRDLTRASLCLMPSRVEGFGLVALEAIAAGTPVLAAASSGAAEFLRTRLGQAADALVVEITDQNRCDVRTWSAAIARVLADLPAAFAHVHDVRERLAQGHTWADTARALAAALRRDDGGRLRQ